MLSVCAQANGYFEAVDGRNWEGTTAGLLGYTAVDGDPHLRFRQLSVLDHGAQESAAHCLQHIAKPPGRGGVMNTEASASTDPFLHFLQAFLSHEHDPAPRSTVAVLCYILDFSGVRAVDVRPSATGPGTLRHLTSVHSTANLTLWERLSPGLSVQFSKIRGPKTDTKLGLVL